MTRMVKNGGQMTATGPQNLNKDASYLQLLFKGILIRIFRSRNLLHEEIHCSLEAVASYYPNKSI
jgi:hypothetical protein